MGAFITIGANGPAHSHMVHDLHGSKQGVLGNVDAIPGDEQHDVGFILVDGNVYTALREFLKRGC